MRKDKQISVLQIITRLDKGGSAEIVLKLAARLDGRTFVTEIISGRTVDPQYPIDAYTKRTGIKVRFLRRLERDVNLYGDLLTIVTLCRLIRQIKPDLVHTHCPKAGTVGRVAARICGVPIIIHAPHGHVFYGYFGRITTKLFLLLERLFAPWTDKIITLTELGKNDHVELRVAPPDKFIAIPCGINLRKFQQRTTTPTSKRRELGFAEHAPVIGTIGRLISVKGQCDFLNAAVHVVREFPNAAFVLVGSGELRDTLIAQAKELQIDQQTYFLGQRDDIPEILSTFDLFVLPSHNEGLGRVLLEAMAVGKPIVGTTVGGIPEIVEDGVTGFLVPPHAPAQMAAAILRLLRDPKLTHALGKAGKTRVKAFDLQQMVARTEAIYRQLFTQKMGMK
ncbi:MAG: glycosyltransferase family 4 protein [Candidatus Poribacteria bacterium]|nr:glycosyltransferase family 4 protein [Candidatus Poribacteria bacterium]